MPASQNLIEEAYVQSNNPGNASVKTAFLYKRKVELDTIQDKVMGEIKASLGPFATGSGEAILDTIEEQIATFLSIEGKNYKDQELMQLLERTFNDPLVKQIPYFPSIYDICLFAKETTMDIHFPQDNLLEDEKKEQISDIFRQKRGKYKADLMMSISFTDYFKKPFDEIKENGMVYLLPAGIHEWEYNASWLLGHLNKGTEFIIYSDINQENKLNRSGKFGSGFFREIAICYFLGYKCQRQGDQIVLKPTNPNLLQNLQLHEILSISQDAHSLKNIEQYYDQAIKDYNELLRLKQQSLNANAVSLQSNQQSNLDQLGEQLKQFLTVNPDIRYSSNIQQSLPATQPTLDQLKQFLTSNPDINFSSSVTSANPKNRPKGK